MEAYCGLQFQPRVHNGGKDMAAHDQNRKLKDRIFDHKHEAERV